jgi:hypothetical protein
MKSQKAAIGISAILLSFFCCCSSSAQDSIPFENSLKEANLTVTTIQDAHHESLILGNGDLYGIVW